MPSDHIIRAGSVAATLMTGDALEHLKGLPSGSIDLVVTSPPYFMGKSYEKSISAADFVALHNVILPEIERVTQEGGSICWQVGSHLKGGELIPLDALVYLACRTHTKLILRNRIVWTFGHGYHGQKRFSGRHETVLWFTKGEKYHFDLDKVRIPQKYPGKTAYKGPKKGQLSGNPLGKNPGDVWDIPNVKSRHPEKVAHPCQFPIALAQRFVRALTKPDATVLDPFMGSGTSGVAALIDGRNFIGIDMHNDYVQLAAERIQSAIDGRILIRSDKPPRVPVPGEKVALRPAHFINASP